jgi:hypothetical protein
MLRLFKAQQRAPPLDLLKQELSIPSEIWAAAGSRRPNV